MIKGTDIIQDNLFDKQIKDTLKLAMSLEAMEKELEKIAKTSNIVESKDTFKNYDKLKTLENEVASLEKTLTALASIETERIKIVKDSKKFTSEFSNEIKELTDKNDGLENQIRKVNIVTNQEIREIKELNTQLDVNKRRIDVLVNSNKALNNIEAKKVTQTVSLITGYRNLDEILLKQIRINRELSKVDGFGDKQTRKVNRFTKAIESLRRVSLRSFNILNKNARVIDKTGVNALKSARNVSKLERALKGLKKIGSTLGLGVLFGGAASLAKSGTDAVLSALTSSRIAQIGMSKAGDAAMNLVVEGFNKFITFANKVTLALGFIDDRGVEFINKKTGENVTETLTNEQKKNILKAEVEYKSKYRKTTPFTESLMLGAIPELKKLTQEDFNYFLNPLEKIIEKNRKSLTESRIKAEAQGKIFYNRLIGDPRDMVAKQKVAEYRTLVDDLKQQLEPDNLRTAALAEQALYKSLTTQSEEVFVDIRDKIKNLSIIQLPLSISEREQFLEGLYNDFFLIPENKSSLYNIVQPKNKDDGTMSPISLDNLVPKQTSKDFQDLLNTQFDVDRLKKEVAELNLEFEKNTANADDATKSITERLNSANIAKAKAIELGKKEKELAEANLVLAEKAIKSALIRGGLSESEFAGRTPEQLFTELTEKDSKIGGLLPQEAIDAFGDALVGIDEANFTITERRRANAQQTRELLSDDLELTLDTLRDNADKIKTVNEIIINDEAEVLTKRQQTLKDTEDLLNNSYNAQLEALVNYQKDLETKLGDAPTNITVNDIDKLVGETDIVKLNDAIRALGFSEILTKQVMDTIRERQQVISDLAEDTKIINEATLNLGFTEEDILLLKNYIKKLEVQNNALANLQNAFKNETDKKKLKALGKEIEVEILNIDETTDTYYETSLALQIKQAKERIAELKKLGLSEIEQEKELQELLLEQQEFYLNKKAKLNEKETEDKETEYEKQIASYNAMVSVLTALNDKVANDSLRRIDDALEATRSREQFLIGLAENGSDKLIENLAFEQKKQAELELERERIDKQREKRLLIITTLQTYLAELSAAKERGDSNPGVVALGKTALNTALLTAFVSALPSFYEGTEDTGNGGALDNKNGFLSVLHPHERVLTAEQNKKLGGLSNEQLVSRITNNENNKTPFIDNSLLVKKLDNLIDITKSKETYLGGDYQKSKKSFIETIKVNDSIKRKHYRSDNLW